MTRSRALFVALWVTVGGCSRGSPPIDERLLVALEQARAWQHRADIHLVDHDVASAIADVEQVLRIEFPKGAAEGEEARLDAWARLARLHLGPSEAEESRALSDVDRGRAEATRDSFYRAHLETVAGEILEARAARLAPAEVERARSVRKEALDAYARSIAIDQRVQATLRKEEP
jgi:hypothetical protein